MCRKIILLVGVAVLALTHATPASAEPRITLRGQQVIARFDVNRDGKIDSRERVASKIAAHQRYLAAEAARIRAQQINAMIRAGINPWRTGAGSSSGSSRSRDKEDREREREEEKRDRKRERRDRGK